MLVGFFKLFFLTLLTRPVQCTLTCGQVCSGAADREFAAPGSASHPLFLSKCFGKNSTANLLKGTLICQ